jgi:hypothetical protein
MTDKIPDKRDDLTRNDTSSKVVATASRDAPAPSTSSVARSPLFKLSPELRNRIYRLVLVADTWAPTVDWQVVVDKANGIPEPALLLSNKIVRSETYGIFYYENDFLCIVSDCDPAPIFLLQAKFTMPFRDHPTDIEVVRDHSGGNWKNLVSWLHMCHRGECAGLTRQEEVPPEERGETRLLDGLFTVATDCPEMSPSTLQKVIEPMRGALEAHDPYWWH